MSLNRANAPVEVKYTWCLKECGKLISEIFSYNGRFMGFHVLVP